MSSGAGPSCVMSSNVPAASSSETASARAFMSVGLLQRSLHRQPDIGHLLADPGGGGGDLHLRLGGRVLRLDHFLLGPERLDLRLQLPLGVDQLLLLVLELRHLLVE